MHMWHSMPDTVRHATWATNIKKCAALYTEIQRVWRAVHRLVALGKDHRVPPCSGHPSEVYPMDLVRPQVLAAGWALLLSLDGLHQTRFAEDVPAAVNCRWGVSVGRRAKPWRIPICFHSGLTNGSFAGVQASAS